MQNDVVREPAYLHGESRCTFGGGDGTCRLGRPRGAGIAGERATPDVLGPRTTASAWRRTVAHPLVPEVLAQANWQGYFQASERSFVALDR